MSPCKAAAEETWLAVASACPKTVLAWKTLIAAAMALLWEVTGSRLLALASVAVPASTAASVAFCNSCLAR